MSLTADELAQEIRSAIAGKYALGPVELAEALFPFIERHIAAGQEGAGDYPHEQMDAIAAERYKVLPTNAGFWPFCVKAGDGEQELYKGHRNSCEAVARQLTGAFLDGGFAATVMLATPQPPKPAGASPTPAADAGGVTEEMAIRLLSHWFGRDMHGTNKSNILHAMESITAALAPEVRHA